MMRRFLPVLVLLVVLPGYSAGPAFNSFQTHYNTPGANSLSATVNTGSGSGYGCVLFWFNRGGTLGTPTCGGNAMTAAGTQVTHPNAGVTSQRYVYFGSGISPGTVTVAGTQTGGTDNQLVVFIVDAASATQPDATGALTSGNYQSVSGGQEAAAAITTATANALVLGEYSSPVPANVNSSNGTYAGSDGVGFGMYYYYSTTNPAISGAYNLEAKNTGGGGPAYTADAISIAASAATVTANPSVSVVAVGSPQR